MLATTISLPVIDLTDFPSELNKLAAASTTLGCFRVVNHGIPAAILAEMKAVVRSLFDISADAKLLNADVIPGSGYMSPSPKNPFYESFGLYDAASSSDVHAFCSLLEASPFHRETISSYALKLHALIVEIASKVAESLGLAGYSFQDWPCQLRLNKYNFTNETVGFPGVQIHTDSGFLTVLQEDESVGGLEIMDRTGNFVAVDPEPGTFLVNLGDIGKVWSNGRLHNVKHRVECKEARPRVSIALFMLAPKDDRVEPQQELIDSDHPRLYQTFSFEEYRKLRLNTEARAGEALSLLAFDQRTVRG
ncbi:2-oxoglutarate-dependent dioxygenase DAO-like [Phalaenopsis equestris]|uniref:2-oxoglutarate-dependent dioxygenase DAO-like n=1 Tax=Phalaenopsis equestris TaxID=78828 RepID=UPI0009E60F9A|nr:2-oxoglutarate-dependent dioxygenase DAO-like [Phalaenopsis equestris]